MKKKDDYKREIALIVAAVIVISFFLGYGEEDNGEADDGTSIAILT